MTIPASDILPLRAAYSFGAEHGLEAEMAAIREMDIEDHQGGSSLRRSYIISLLE